MLSESMELFRARDEHDLMVACDAPQQSRSSTASTVVG
jgi:hypothetical protein